MVFEAWLSRAIVEAQMIVEVVVLVLAVAGAEASVDVEARVVLLVIRQGAAGTHL